ncbi:helix-turn-helix domain-containing protein [Pseudonocardiaceae bacterium YIM PH 21723]|nr:helix-turn-helix domain-containing protein [Pseudonocardiaceae bacterium YIM PH 21723]
MQIAVLGTVRLIRDDDVRIPLSGLGQRALLAVLACEAGRVISVERLIDGLHGDRPPAGAANALQAQASRLRRTLGESGLVVFESGGYRLAIDPELVDLHRFTALTERARDRRTSGDHQGAAELLSAAVGLWHGPALADVREAPFATPVAVRLEEQRVAALEDWADSALAVGAAEQVVEPLRAAIAEHPLRERLRARWLLVLAAVGRQAEALAGFDEIRRLLAEELGADPGAELAEVHAGLLTGTPPPPDPVRAVATTLPSPLTSFIGRSAELAGVLSRLGEHRLVTLLGPGGVGKTRLATEAAAGLHAEVCFVDLSPITGSEQVPHAVGAALGVRGNGNQNLVHRLLLAAADRDLLLVLDNCEHVIAAAAGLIHRLLTGCPRLRVLATSREPLGITGEALFPVSPLPLDPAVTLLAERAAAVCPGFTLDTPESVRLAERVCAALDGLPLAVELAAARLRSLSLAEVAARLDDRFGLLSRGPRTSAPRHQTLHAVVAWSWELLSPADQRTAMALSVFDGGARAAAVAAVTGTSESTVDDALLELVDRSLAEVTDGRYRMLETIREFCAARQVETGQTEFLRARSVYYLDLALEASPRLLGAEQLDRLRLLTAEHHNLTLSLRREITDGQAETALDLIGALAGYWRIRGVRGEISPLARLLLDRLGQDVPEDRAEEYVLTVMLASMDGAETDGLAGHLTTAARIMNERSWPVRQPYLLVYWANQAGPAQGEQLHTPIYRMLRNTRDRWLQGLLHFGLGYLRLYDADLAAADDLLGQALAAFTEVGDRWGMAQVLDAQSDVAARRGDLAESLRITDLAMARFRELDSREEVSELQVRSAERLAALGRTADAERMLTMAVQLATRTGVAATVAAAHHVLGDLARRRGEYRKARNHLELGLAACGADFGSDVALIRLNIALSRLELAEHGPERARPPALTAMAVAVAHRLFGELTDATEVLAEVRAAAGDTAAAAGLSHTAAALRGPSTPQRDEAFKLVEAQIEGHPVEADSR